MPSDRMKAHSLAGLSLLFGAGLLWPALINGGPLLFPDSFAYVEQGRQAVEGVIVLLMKSAETGAANTSGFEAASASATYIRSLSWSGFAYVASQTALGLWGPVLVQSLLVSALILLLLAPVAGARRSLLGGSLGILAVFTTLPWFASYMMPDILAAVLVLAGMVLVQDVTIHPAHFVLIAFASAFAVASHYGFVPLGAAMAAAVLLVLGLQRRLTPGLAVMAVAPLLVAVVATMAASQVAFDSPDVAPKRLPILLARSIEDGPAQWYLQQACPEAGYVLCPHIADMPTAVGSFLWGPDSLLKKLSDEDLEALRAEETEILIGAFRAYPLQQSWALIGNGVRQLVSIGTDDFQWGGAIVGPDGKLTSSVSGTDHFGLKTVEQIQAVVVIISLVSILVFALKDRLSARPDERGLLFVLLVGLLANAAIFGGLSVPVDRYQARIIWLVPLLAMLLGLNRLRQSPLE